MRLSRAESLFWTGKAGCFSSCPAQLISIHAAMLGLQGSYQDAPLVISFHRCVMSSSSGNDELPDSSCSERGEPAVLPKKKQVALARRLKCIHSAHVLFMSIFAYFRYVTLVI